MTGAAAWGAIFDWDGVIVHSAAQHEASWERLALEEKKPLPEGHFLRGFGMKNEKIIPALLAWTQDLAEIARLSLRKEELYRQIVLESDIHPLPGVATFLQRLQAARVPCVIGSSTHRLNITTTLEKLGLRDYFSAIVSAEDVSNGKPDPEVFLKAAAAIGVEPERCVVFEDALVGIEAAQTAGMRVVAVTTTLARPLLQKADIVVDQLDELDPAALAGHLFASNL